IWEGNNMSTSILNIKDNKYVRVISNTLVAGLLKELSAWMKSEILRRVIAQCLMQDADNLGNCDTPFYDTYSLEVKIPGWVDDGKEWTDLPTHKSLGTNVPTDYHNRYKTPEFVHETKTPIWHFVMNDFALEELSHFIETYYFTNYRESLNDIWFALMCIPPLKHRMCQVFTFAYQKLATNLSITDGRETFFNLSVQLFTIPSMTCGVSRTHNLLEIVMNSLMHFLCDTTPPNLTKGPSNQNAFELMNEKNDVDEKGQPRTTPQSRAQNRHTRKAVLAIGKKDRSMTTTLFDIRYILTNDTVVPYLFSHRRDILIKWCQVLVLLQNTCDLHREVGDHISIESNLWQGAFNSCLRVFSINRTIISIVYRLLLSPQTQASLALKQHIWDTLAHVIADAFTMIDWKQWESIVWGHISANSTTSSTRNAATATADNDNDNKMRDVHHAKEGRPLQSTSTKINKNAKKQIR
ncbi:hypothetical protein RFI_24250, partial [Reticulomyxa filosa]